MNKIKKSLIFMTKCLIFMFVFAICKPINAETEDEYLVWVNGIQVTDSNKNDVLGDLDGEKTTVIFTPANGDKKAKLTLNGATIYNGYYDSMRGTTSAIQSNEDMVIEIKGNNFLGKYNGEEVGEERLSEKYSVDYGILADRKNLDFIGDGSLSIIDRSDGINAYDVTFDEKFGSLNIYDDGFDVLPPCAISLDGNLTINGGEFNLISVQKNGITAKKVYINNGFIKIKADYDKNRNAIFTTEGIFIDNKMEVINANHIKDDIDALVVANNEIDNGYITIRKAVFLVDFNSNGGTSVNSQNIMKNNKIVKPINPTKENYVFDGWYIDEELTELFDFNTPVTKNITLYAKWREKESFTYKIIDGDNQKLTIGNIKSYILKIDGNYSLFESLKIGNLDLIKDEDYEVTEGSTVITFKDKGLSKLNTLPKGEFELLIKYQNGEKISGKLIINVNEENPKTGDKIILYIVIGSLSLIGLSCSVLYINSKKFN